MAAQAETSSELEGDLKMEREWRKNLEQNVVRDRDRLAEAKLELAQLKGVKDVSISPSFKSISIILPYAFYSNTEFIFKFLFLVKFCYFINNMMLDYRYSISILILRYNIHLNYTPVAPVSKYSNNNV
jgi:hypothetical protein